VTHPHRRDRQWLARRASQARAQIQHALRRCCTAVAPDAVLTVRTYGTRPLQDP